MKLSVTLSLALASACSAFALSPGGSRHESLVGHHPQQHPHTAFVVRPTVHEQGPLGALHATSSAVACASADESSAMSTRGGGGALGGFDVPLLIYFALWYLGNYYYNISNKLALKATGGAAGFPMTISALQLGIGSLYGIFLWLAPDARKKPTVTLDDVSLFSYTAIVWLII